MSTEPLSGAGIDWPWLDIYILPYLAALGWTVFGVEKNWTNCWVQIAYQCTIIVAPVVALEVRLLHWRLLTCLLVWRRLSVVLSF